MPNIKALAIGDNRINLISREEVNEKIGDLTALKTPNQTNTVGAINSLYDTRVEANPVGIMIINYLYPVGSLYFSLDATFNPNTAWQGTTWELIKKGCFIEATDATPGEEKEAGLPNLQGQFSKGGVGGDADHALFEAAYTGGAGLNGGGGGAYTQFTMDASKYNPIYGNSDTVQPHSITALIWQRKA